MAEGKFVIWCLSVLLFSQAILTAAEYDRQEDDYHIEYTGGACGSSSQSLGDGCSISDDCSTITCRTKFVEKSLTLKLKVNQCEDPVTVTASMDVPDLDITWSHTYTSDDIVAVPGFTFSLGPVSGGVYVQVELNPNDNSGNLRLKVKLLGGASFGEHSAYPVKLPIMDGDLPISTDDCGIIEWFNNLSDILKAALIGGPLIVLIFLIICCCCCCCRTTPNNRGTIIMTAPAPGAVIATSHNTTVPMRPLVNEA